MNNFSPVFIFTLCRYVHFKRCIESLSFCANADKTDLYIAFDYPLLEEHWDGYKKIEQYINEIKGFRSINIIKRTINYGVSKNFTDGLAEVFEKYDRVIISEDDNYFAPNFLSFVNKGLNLYENRDDIFSINGYNSPPKMPLWYQQDVFMIRAWTTWGVGVWKKKWKKVDWSIDVYNSMLNKKDNWKELKKNYASGLHQLKKISETGYITGDAYIVLYLIDNSMYSVYPVKSRVRNTGNDGSGVNCGIREVYSNQEIFMGHEEATFPLDLKPDNKLSVFFFKQYRLSFTRKLKNLIPLPVREKILTIIGK